MKLLKELFSFDEFKDESDLDDEDEFDFDLSDEESELDFDNKTYSPFDGDDDFDEFSGDDDFDDDFGVDGDYPERLSDMPHDDFEDDSEFEFDDEDDSEFELGADDFNLDGGENQEEEINSISKQIDDLHARLGKLAARGDISLY